MTTQSLTQFSQEVGRSRDTVSKAIASLGLTVPKPSPGKPTELSVTVQDALRTHFGAYPQVGHIREAPSVQQIDPRVITALERIHKGNLEAHQTTQMQVTGLKNHVGSLQSEVETLTELLTELRADLAESRQALPEVYAPKRPLSVAPMAIAAAVLIGLVGVWATWQSPHTEPDGERPNPAHAELYQ
jgi:hypothetical protein